jgi:hypothetical protein
MSASGLVLAVKTPRQRAPEPALRIPLAPRARRTLRAELRLLGVGQRDVFQPRIEADGAIVRPLLEAQIRKEVTAATLECRADIERRGYSRTLIAAPLAA